MPDSPTVLLDSPTGATDSTTAPRRILAGLQARASSGHRFPPLARLVGLAGGFFDPDTRVADPTGGFLDPTGGFLDPTAGFLDPIA
jgi:hypothetical protein